MKSEKKLDPVSLEEVKRLANDISVLLLSQALFQRDHHYLLEAKRFLLQDALQRCPALSNCPLPPQWGGRKQRKEENQ